MTLNAYDTRLYETRWDDTTLFANRHTLYLTRKAHVQQQMVKHDVPVLLICDPNNIFYMTGARNMQLFGLRSPSRYLLAFHAGPTILFEYVGCEHLAQGLPTIDTILPAMGLNKLASGDDALGAGYRFAQEIADLVRAYDPTIDKIGIDRFPFQSIDALRAQGFTLCDADDALIPTRAIKLPIELPYMREAMRRVEGAVQRMEETVRPGVSESEAWAEFHYAFMAKEGQYISTRLFQSGPNTFPYFQEADTRKLEQGDLLCLDSDALGYEGYAVDFSRTFLCGDGKATDEQRYLYDLAREQLEFNAGLLRPGMEYRELAEKAWVVPEEHQESRYYCVGHGLGMAGEWPNIPHYKKGEPYSLDGIIEPGMVICLESYIGSSALNQGVKLENQYLILEETVTCMSDYHFDARLSCV